MGLKNFITFESLDEGGKGTQIKLVGARLIKLGHQVVQLASPNENTATGRMVRRGLTGEVEMTEPELQQLFTEDKLVTLNRDIRPALEENKIVLMDRWDWSFDAYAGLNLDRATMDNILRVTFGKDEYRPCLRIFLKISVDEAMRRLEADKGKPERFEKRHLLEQVSKNYLDLIIAHPEEVVVIDGSLSREEIADQIVQAIKHYVL